MSFNKVLILGNAGKDPEIRHLEGGAAVANRQERTEWHNIVCWRQLAEFAERFVKKGTQVFIEGKIRTREYNDQNGQRRFVTEIVADTLQLTGRKPEGQGGVQPQGGYQSQGSYQQPQRPVQPAPATPAPQDFPAMDDFNASSDANDLPF